MPNKQKPNKQKQQNKIAGKRQKQNWLNVAISHSSCIFYYQDIAQTFSYDSVANTVSDDSNMR